jgi:hypothetical protein
VNEYGYVYYFLVEFMKLFKIEPLLADCASTPGRYMKEHLLEVRADGRLRTMGECLCDRYAKWVFDASTLRYLIVELLRSPSHSGATKLQMADLEESGEMSWSGRTWSLQSMIVFDCSHFVAYVRKDGAWLLYDDTRSLDKQPLQAIKFGEVYRSGACAFEYGRKNTFFFFVPDGAVP